MMIVKTLEQYRTWVKAQCEKDVRPDWGREMVDQFEGMIRAEIVTKLRELETRYDQAWETAIAEAAAGERHGLNDDEHSRWCNGLLDRADVVRECIKIAQEV